MISNVAGHVVVDSDVATLADGADIAEGATTDAAVIADVSGSISGKIRGLVKIFADVWDSVNHRLKVDGSGVTQPVSIATMPTTPVSVASLPNVQEAQGSPLLEVLGLILVELRSIRLATVANTCDGGRYKESDFDPDLFISEILN